MVMLDITWSIRSDWKFKWALWPVNSLVPDMQTIGELRTSLEASNGQYVYSLPGLIGG